MSLPREIGDTARAWRPPADWTRILCVDAHTAGEPLRVVVDGFPTPPGSTVLERRAAARRQHDDLRCALMWEPRGHADMYGCLVGPPTTPDGDFSVLFTHNEGFSTMCGHGIVAVVTVVAECGLLGAVGDGLADFAIDTPAGRVAATVRMEDDRALSVRFRNVPSFVFRLDGEVEVPGVGEVRYDVAYGGAFYAFVDAADFGFSLEPDEVTRLIEVGRAIKEAVQASDPPAHPTEHALGFVYGTIFVGPAHGPEAHSRNVCVFADGEVDRSPTGTGVSARLALHHARGELEADRWIEVESILGTTFRGRVVETCRSGPHAAVVPEVEGRAWITGRNEILIAPDDPLRAGFLLR